MQPEQLTERTVPKGHQNESTGQGFAFEGYTLAGRCATPMTVSEFRDRSVHVLARLGSKADNFTSADLVKLMDDRTINGRDALALASLYQMVTYSSPMGKAQLPINSRADVQALSEHGPSKAQLLNLLDAVGPKFTQADKNGDSKLDSGEIKTNPYYSDLLKSFPNLILEEKKGGGALRKEQFDAEFQTGLAHSYFADNYTHTEVELRHRMETSYTHKLYSDEKNPLNSIKIEDIHQGYAGNCYFEAALAAQAKQNPAAIRDAIKDNGDGTFTVTFRGDRTHPVKINAPTEAELAIYNGGAAGGMWPAVMEKAFAKYLAEYHRTSDGTRTDMDLSSAGRPRSAIQLLTGHHANDINKDNQKAAAISAALKEGKLVGADFWQDDKSKNLFARHEYTVVDYKPGWWQGGTITLRNPWGDKSQESGDTFTLSFDEFIFKSGTVTVESDFEIPPLSEVPNYAKLGRS